MAASMMANKVQSSFMGSSLRTQRPFVPSRASPVAGTVLAAYGNRVNLGGGKPWERTEVNSNGKPVKVKMHVKAGDIVQVGSSFSMPFCFLPYGVGLGASSISAKHSSTAWCKLQWPGGPTKAAA
eukprot:GHUV01042781.1.p2 GENE.GHUV01042781.1~~GHUV01042781.1.p2  ORF type:complete len:125 (-),score=44.26 GHUV01042781.1:452-826(-)